MPATSSAGLRWFGAFASRSADVVNSRLVVLAGPSGSGKSSVVRAGLIPELRNADTDVAVIYPGSTPTATLSAATERLDQDRKSVLVVDQLEELFTLPPRRTEPSSSIHSPRWPLLRAGRGYWSRSGRTSWIACWPNRDSLLSLSRGCSW